MLRINEFKKKKEIIKNGDESIADGIDLKSIYDLPNWYHRYPHILHGYRYNLSFYDVMKSLFKIHNETMNIWTEYTPFIFETSWLIYLCFYEQDFILSHSLTTQLIVPICLFIGLFRAMISGTTHLLHCMNATISRYCWNMDYISIIIYSALGAIIWSHLLFYCNVYQQIACMISIFVLSVSSIICVVYATNDKWRDIWLILKIVYDNFILLGYLIISTLLSITDIPPIFILYWIIAILIGMIAAIIRATEWPEKQCVKSCLKSHITENRKNVSNPITQQFAHYLPIIAKETKSKWYYYIFTSHNWWHICIHLSAFLVIYTFREYLLWRAKNQCQ